MRITTSDTTAYVGEVRLSWPKLFERDSMPGQSAEAGKYSTAFFFSKDNAEIKNAIDKVVEAAINKGIVSKWMGKRPTKLQMPLRDGDSEPGKGYDGCYFLNAKTNNKPIVVDKGNMPILDTTEIYGGVYAWLRITAYPYAVNGNNGVAFWLDAVMKTKDGEPLSSSTITASTAFAAIAEEDEF